jgi:DNA-nicking Smr family endonuclease
MSRRPLNKSEQQLWQHVTKDVRRLQGSAAAVEQFSDLMEASRPVFEKQPQRPAAPVASAPKKPAPQRRKTATSQQSVFEAGDPRVTKQVRRGKREIDATLDLHGYSQDQAYVMLQTFLMKAKARGLRTLLVITGKGARETMHVPIYHVSRGVLRHRFLEWVEGPFREHIASVKQAHQRHGGSGAFYVIMRKTD